MAEQKRRDYFLPASILIAALLISVSLVYSAGKRSGDGGTASLTGGAGDNERVVQDSSIGNIRPVTREDHILGSIDAPIKIVEFSDLECPFCKRFHVTMQQVVAEYGDQVAWVYRHLPLDSIHSKARKEAEASECAAELGGNDAFWAYIDRLFEITPSNNGLNLALLPQIARDIGLDQGKFESCLESGAQLAQIVSDIEDAENSGARGTPYSVIIASDGKKYTIPGALPFERVKLLIDQALESNR
ncbi:MAG: DsbA family protein [Patescibacteria group bacterium]|nr:DsbA family protein [Patescibacteria group bacterium]